jgi:hypothetical protein
VRVRRSADAVIILILGSITIAVVAVLVAASLLDLLRRVL